MDRKADMDLTAQIRRELFGVLKKWADGKKLAVVFENTAVRQPENEYAEVWLMPSATESGSLNTPKQSGMLQVLVFVPPNKGTARADALAAEVMGCFPCGLVLGTVSLPNYPSRSQGRMVNGWYAVAVTVEYWAMV